MNSFQVDYNKVAMNYEKNPDRHRISIDGDLFNILITNNHKPMKILDVGCGTGLYIQYQKEYMKDYQIEWIGVDPSPSMLNLAKLKVKDVQFFLSGAEEMPFEKEQFDYIYSSYAFHHFQDKKKALGEMARVIKSLGALKIITISHKLLSDWYIYKFFPKTKKIDQLRCWSPEQIRTELEILGFEVVLHIEQIHRTFLTQEIFRIVSNRDISELVLLNDEEYQLGLSHLENFTREHNQIRDIFTQIIVNAKKI